MTAEIVRMEQYRYNTPRTIPGALKALDELEVQLISAKTYEELHRMVDAANAFKLLYKDIERVRHRAEEVVLAGHARIGEELAKIPIPPGPGRGKRGSRSGTPFPGPGATGIVRSSRHRQMKIAEAKREGKLEAVVSELRSEGKNATPHAVYQRVSQKRKGREEHIDQINRFIRRLGKSWYDTNMDIKKWFRTHKRVNAEDRAALAKQLYSVSDSMMNFANDITNGDE